jgi:hypothetical protein
MGRRWVEYETDIGTYGKDMIRKWEKQRKHLARVWAENGNLHC